MQKKEKVYFSFKTDKIISYDSVAYNFNAKFRAFCMQLPKEIA